MLLRSQSEYRCLGGLGIVEHLDLLPLNRPALEIQAKGNQRLTDTRQLIDQLLCKGNENFHGQD